MSNAKHFGPGAVKPALARAVEVGVASVGGGTQAAVVPEPGTAAGTMLATGTGAGTGAIGTKSVEVTGSGDLGVSVPQEQAIRALAIGRTTTDAAAEAGVSRRTLHRWLAEDAAFIAAYNAWRRDAAQSARGRMMALTGDAVEALAGAGMGGLRCNCSRRWG
jgi:hypothetical protein